MFGNVYLSIFMYSTNSFTITNYNGLKLITMEWRKEKYFSRWQICVNPHGTPPEYSLNVLQRPRGMTENQE